MTRHTTTSILKKIYTAAQFAVESTDLNMKTKGGRPILLITGRHVSSLEENEINWKLWLSSSTTQRCQEVFKMLHQIFGYNIGGNELKMTTLAEDQYEGNPYFQDEIRKVFLLILENCS